MFRGFNLDNNNIKFTATLYQNRREKLAVVNNEWIDKITRNLEEIDSMDFTIPKFIGKDKKFNPIYIKINPQQQIIIEEENKLGQVVKSRFVLIETTKELDKNMGIKRFKAMSFENKLKNKRTKFEGKVMQLKSDEVHIEDGILDKFVKEVPDWKLGYIDNKSRIEARKGMENIVVDLFDDYTKDNIIENSIIWEKEVLTTVEDGLPLYLSFEYRDFKIYNKDGSLLINNPSIVNPITLPLYNNIKKVVARHYSDVGNRFGIEYEFTLVDDVIEKRIETFTNIIDKNIACKNIRMVWETGKVIEDVNIKYINIESIDDNWYNALVQLQDQFNSVILFDSYEKSISIIHRDNLGKNSGYLLSYDNNMVNVSITEESTYPNGLKVIGKDGLSIANENIHGGDVIYNYDYYIEKNLMSDELIQGWKRYEIYLTEKQEEFIVIKNERMAIQQRKTKIDSEIKSLNERIKNLTNLLSAYIAEESASDQARVKTEIDDLKKRLEECLFTRINYEKELLKYDDEIVQISKDINKTNATDKIGKIFTDETLEEIQEIESVDIYEDSYYSIPYALLEHSKTVLADMVKPQIDYNINCTNLSKVIQNPKGWNHVLKLGDLFNINKDLADEFGINDNELRLVSYEYSPKDDIVENPIFSNKFKKIDIKKSISNIGKKTTDNSNVIGSFKEIWEDAILSNDWVGEVIDKGLDLNANIISGRGMKNYISMDEAGIFLMDQTDTNKQLYMGSSTIGMTTDGFKTSEICINADGVIGKTIFGKILLGKKLYITSDKENGEFFIGDIDKDEGFGIQIKDENKRERIFIGTELDSNGIKKATFRLTSKTGRELVISEDGIISHNQFQISDNMSPGFPMNTYINMDEGVFEVRKVKLFLKLEKYRAFEKGTSSGGSSTSSSGGAYSSTSSSGGSYSSTSSGGGSYSSTKTSESISPFGDSQETERSVIWSDSSSILIRDGSYLSMDRLSHRHKYYYYTLPHTHKYLIDIPGHAHSFSIPNHTHPFSIPNHTHTAPSHVHALNYAIYEDSKPTNVRVYVNDVLTNSGIYTDAEVDITRYIQLNKINKVRIESDTNGRIVCNVFSKTFVGY